LSLLEVAERFASIDRSQVVLDGKRCLHALDTTSDCTACIQVCPVEAISVEQPPVLNESACQNCLACLTVCPVGALFADDDVSSLLNCVTRLEDTSFELICGQHPEPTKGQLPEQVAVRIQGCLAGLGTGAYVSLSALGSEHISLRCAACDMCKWKSLKSTIENQARATNQFLAAWGKKDSIVCVDAHIPGIERPLWDAKNPPISRRDLFRMLGRQGQISMARAMENGARRAERQPGRDRMRLLTAVAHLPEPISPDDASLDALDFVSVKVSGDCTACGACAKACPADALWFQKNNDETAFTLTFTVNNCINCGLCVHVCGPEAIELDRNLDFDNVFGDKTPRIVFTGELVRCTRCNNLMAVKPGARFCTLCEYRRSHPFESILPEELRSKLRSTNPEQKS